jgi:hypothetical protein
VANGQQQAGAEQLLEADSSKRITSPLARIFMLGELLDLIAAVDNSWQD